MLKSIRKLYFRKKLKVELLVNMINFPMFLNLNSKKVFVCGSGKAIEDKIGKLLEFNPEIYFFPECENEKTKYTDKIITMDHPLEEEDLKVLPAFVVASCNENRNIVISRACRKYNIPVNIVDHPGLCDFIFGSMITTDKICIGISSSGVSPSAAIRLKKDILDVVPDNIDSILEDMPSIRSWVHTWCSDKEMVKKVLAHIVSEAFNKDRSLTQKELYCIKNKYLEE